jgi:hypothetical protein
MEDEFSPRFSQGHNRGSPACRAMLPRQVVRGGQQVLRAFKPRIQASKPRNIHHTIADVAVVAVAFGAIAEIWLTVKHQGGK